MLQSMGSKELDTTEQLTEQRIFDICAQAEKDILNARLGISRLGFWI